MILPIVKYGHPSLRQKGARVEAVNSEVRRLVADMFETMYGAGGLGLAAQQIGRALQITVLDVRGISDRPSTLHIGGREVDVEDHMPMVLINPELKLAGERVSGPEGCLSFPEIYAEIERPEEVEVSALNEKGELRQFQCGGLLARAIQHEADHLYGILFIDRMTRRAKEELREHLNDLQAATKEELKKQATANVS